MQQTHTKSNMMSLHRDEFDLLFEKHLNRLLYFAKGITLDSLESEDIVLEAFIKLWNRKDVITAEQNRLSFLYITIRNACLNYLRHKKVRRKHENEFRYLNQGTFENDPDGKIEQNIYGPEVSKDIIDELKRLPYKTKLIFEMHFIDGLKTEEIMERLNISRSTVRVQIHNARKAISGALFKRSYLNRENLKSYAPDLLANIREDMKAVSE
jgi:RNA polymerase sigma-70 factor, ECF subfamily